VATLNIKPEDLRRTIESDFLTLHFQPQVRVSDGALEGLEAFVRWPHPIYGMLGPSDVIPLVEKGGLHADFDRWVVRAACAQLIKWRDGGVRVPIVATNIWGRTLQRPDAVDVVFRGLAETGVDPRWIELETPRGTLSDKALVERLIAIHTLGVRLASEELVFGSRPPSALAFDTHKIPFPVSREVAKNARAITFVVETARRAGARVVADSVETVEQEAELVRLGVQIVQGYLYGPEVAPAELHTLLTRPTG
jgi:EAL domain-containing protein (putative c-di-GMP-specific phosphodiesterase class I)